MIDVFVRIYVENELRLGMAHATVERWKLQKDAQLTLLVAEGGYFMGDQWYRWHQVSVPKINFHSVSKAYAEQNAISDIYVVADDDQLILGADWISRGCSILNAHPEYGMLCGWNICEHTRDYGAPPQLDVMELHSIGCPYFVRKGTLTCFPAVDKGYYDGALSKVVTDQGLKTGVMPQVQYNHLGFRYSSIVDWNWSA